MALWAHGTNEMQTDSTVSIFSIKCRPYGFVRADEAP
jgi:hypothetical protein